MLLIPTCLWNSFLSSDHPPTSPNFSDFSIDHAYHISVCVPFGSPEQSFEK